MIGFCSLCGQFSFGIGKNRLCRHCRGAHGGREDAPGKHLTSADRTGHDPFQDDGPSSDTPDLHEKEPLEGGSSGGGGASRDFSADEGSESDSTSADDSAGDSDNGDSDGGGSDD